MKVFEQADSRVIDGLIDLHRVINRMNEKDREKYRFLYQMKDAILEVRRLAILHRKERLGELTKLHKQCSRSPVEEVSDNHLTCCLGVKCRECDILKGLEDVPYEPEVIDDIKAWTCLVHALKSTDYTNDGIIMTENDKMYWDNVMQSLSAFDDSPQLSTERSET